MVLMDFVEVAGRGNVGMIGNPLELGFYERWVNSNSWSGAHWNQLCYVYADG